MNILNKLTINNLKLNKKRTIVTIIGILLSTALICAVAGMISSFRATLIKDAKEKYGNYHVTFNEVEKENLKYIEKNRNVKSYFLTQNIGYSLIKSVNEHKPYLNIMAFDDDAFKGYNIELTQGRLPENDKEIVISEQLETDALVKYKIGDTIKLEIGKRIYFGEPLDNYRPYYNNDEGKEELKIEATKEYIVVGKIKRPSYNIEGYSSPGYTAITKLDNIDKANIFVLYKNPKKYKDVTKKITENLKIEKEENSSLLRWEGVGLNDNTLQVLYSLGAIIIFIILISSIFVIKNSFSISITEKFKQYGMLSSVGATSKQIKKNVLFEALILALISIPLGILLGIIAIFILVNLINIILGDYLDGIKFVYSVPFMPILISVIVSSLTIYLSTITSAIKASKISPIEAIRSNNDIKIKSKKLKTPKIIKKIFKIGGEISYKNLKRSKKKYRTTVISLVVSIVIFIALSSFITYGFKMTGIYYEEINYNISISEIRSKNYKETYNKLINISKLDNIDSYSIHRSACLNIDYNKYASKEFSSSREHKQCIEMISLSDEEYNKYVSKLGGNINQYKDKGILLDSIIYYNNDDNKYYDKNIYDIKENEIMSGELDDESKLNLKIIKKTSLRPMGLEKAYSSAGYLIVSDEFMNKINQTYQSEIYIKSNNSKELVKNINNLIKNNEGYSNFVINDIDEQQRAENAMVLIISIFLYGFIAVISLIGITNIFNTITTNMNLRRKEFAMLKSIGMTKKEFNRMIFLESIFYGLKALIFGIIIGLVLSYMIFKVVGQNLSTNYILPINAIIISIIFVFIIVGITMKYSLSKINKQNIIDTIRNDNI